MRLLELGAGAGRNTPRYQGFEQIVLLDYSRTQLQQARQRLGRSERYRYVAADIYRLPFAPGAFDAATMIRTLHHMVDAPRALDQVRQALRPGSVFILEFANKQNLKAIFRYLLRRQAWSPFSPEPVEFAPLNFDFHPASGARLAARLRFRHRAPAHRLALPHGVVQAGPANRLAGAHGLPGPADRQLVAAHPERLRPRPGGWYCW